MTGLIFQEFLHWFDARMTGRKVLLIVDNCPAHPKIVEGLKNTELFFLPLNSTSKIQPMLEILEQLRFIIDVAFIQVSWKAMRKEQ